MFNPFRHPVPTIRTLLFCDFTRAHLTRTSRSRLSIGNGNIRTNADSDVSFTTTSSSCGFTSRDTDTAVNVKYVLLFNIHNFMDIKTCIYVIFIITKLRAEFLILYLYKKMNIKKRSLSNIRDVFFCFVELALGCFMTKRAVLPHFVVRSPTTSARWRDTHPSVVYSRFKRCSLDRFFLCHLCTVTQSTAHSYI